MELLLKGELISFRLDFELGNYLQELFREVTIKRKVSVSENKKKFFPIVGNSSKFRAEIINFIGILSN